MRADAYPLDTVLGERQQWVVPVYQRHYEWETEENRQRSIDTMGNLTLLTEALNPSISNGPWTAKHEKIGKSLLAMNRDIAVEPVWSEAEIEKRAGTLSAAANRLGKAT